MAQLVIKGHATRGKEVIEILEMLGGRNPHSYIADCDSLCFSIGKGTNTIYYDWVKDCYEDKDILVFTLEEFLEKYPYKVGDKVLINDDINDVYTIKSMIWDAEIEEVAYRIEAIDGIEDNYYWFTSEMERYLEQEIQEDKGNISDGYHTFNELYEYRLLYNASMFNELAKQGLYDVHKSKRHSDGTIPFGDENWFIVQAELPSGQISNHYEMKDWDLFNIPEKEKANPYDGHTPQDVAKRLRVFLTPTKEPKEPKFKVGDIVKTAFNKECQYLIKDVSDTHYTLQETEYEFIYTEPIIEDKNWELVESNKSKFDITTLIPFESRVLVRDADHIKWAGDFYMYHDVDEYIVTGGINYKQCIPYEGNEHLLGKTDDCDEYFKTW